MMSWAISTIDDWRCAAHNDLLVVHKGRAHCRYYGDRESIHSRLWATTEETSELYRAGRTMMYRTLSNGLIVRNRFVPIADMTRKDAAVAEWLRERVSPDLGWQYWHAFVAPEPSVAVHIIGPTYAAAEDIDPYGDRPFVFGMARHLRTGSDADVWPLAGSWRNHGSVGPSRDLVTATVHVWQHERELLRCKKIRDDILAEEAVDGATPVLR